MSALNTRLASVRKCLGIVAVSAVTVGLLGACSGTSPELTPEGGHWRDLDTEPIPEPEFHEPSIAWDAFRRATFNQVRQTLDLERSARILTGNREEAWNINSFDELPNSSWFTNRHFMTPMTPGKMAVGDATDPPDTTGKWHLYRPKVGGVTPGFWIKDPRGKSYIIKFDLVRNPERSTSGAIITGRFFLRCRLQCAAGISHLVSCR